MSYYAPAGMTRKKVDGVYVYIFQDQPKLDLRQHKRWFDVKVVRKAFDSKGDVIRKNVQETSVYASEEEAIGLGMKRCPYPWVGQDQADVKTQVFYKVSGNEDNLL